MNLQALFSIVLGFFFCSCISLSTTHILEYDRLNLIIQGLSLNNLELQDSSELSAVSATQRDWVKRRKQLVEIDRALKRVQADLFFVQGARKVLGSDYDNDIKILSEGSLSDYQWKAAENQVHLASGELEQTGLAISYPLSFSSEFEGEKNLWRLGSEVVLSVSSVQHEQQNLNVFILWVRNSEVDSHILNWVQKHISSYLEAFNLCLQRTIMISNLSLSIQDSQDYNHFIMSTGFVSLNKSTCLDNNECLLESSLNNYNNTKSKLELNIHIHESALLSVNSSLSSAYRTSLSPQENASSLKRDLFSTHMVRFARCI